MTTVTSLTRSLREAAAQALTSGEAAVVIGYELNDGEAAAPAFVRAPEDAERLIFDESCFGNLAVYLAKEEVRRLGKLAIVVKGCDLRAINVLLRENVVSRDDLLLIGVRCSGVGRPALRKCSFCEVRDPEGCDTVVGDPPEPPPTDPGKRYAEIEAIEELSMEERWAYWQKQLGKCIRCYACRQVCPLCYCKRCIVEKSTPQWVETSPHLRGNIAWNIARGLHLTGRCVSCGECERVCPMKIPLGSLGDKMAKLVDEWYGFRSGMSADEKAPFTAWSPDDPEPGIL